MIVFCDTSALMKLYVQELHSDWTRREVEACNLCLVSEITWTEMCAALGFKQRTQQIDEAATAAAMKRLRTEWAIYTRLAVDSALVNHAGELALHFGLRAYDSTGSCRRRPEILLLRQTTHQRLKGAGPRCPRPLRPALWAVS